MSTARLKMTDLVWVHQLWMVRPNSEGIYAPSRLTSPYQMTISKLLLMDIQHILVSFHPDGYTDAKLMPVFCGLITGLPRLAVYDGSFVNSKFFQENDAELLQL